MGIPFKGPDSGDSENRPTGPEVMGIEEEDLGKVMKGTDEGVILDICVSPSSKKAGIRGVNVWRGCLEVAVVSRPRKGAANTELLELLSGLMGLGKRSVEILSGDTGRYKRVRISGIDPERVRTLLSRHLS